MQLLNVVQSNFNYGVQQTTDLANKLVKDPSAVKKILQLTDKIFEGIEYYYSTTLLYPKFRETTKGTISLIDLFGNINNIVFWINPFTKEKIDRVVFEQTLSTALTDLPSTVNPTQQSKEIVSNLLGRSEDYYSVQDVLEVLKESLIASGKSEREAAQIVSQVKIQQKSRAVLQTFAMIFYTSASLIGTLISFKNWNVIELGKESAKVGEGSLLGSFVRRDDLGDVARRLANIGLGITFIQSLMELYASSESKDTKKALWSVGASGLELLVTGLSTVISVSKPVLITLSIISKGFGIVKIIHAAK
jgi:hypothetical protein